MLISTDTTASSNTKTPLSDTVYRGRFAPSPTGDLHLGSLMTAVGSYLQARAHHGKWLLRIEDIDPPREQAGASLRILHILEAYGFEWDEAVVYQSQRLSHYAAALAELQRAGLAYPCVCSRREIAAVARAGIDGPIYPGTCRDGIQSARQAAAWRIKVDGREIGFRDGLQGWQGHRLADAVGDFVLKRADGLYAYQLAVVVDDADQGISHIVRGADLLDSTSRQIYLQQCLGFSEPAYLHLPVLVNFAGEKLSKQTRAQPLRPEKSVESIWTALDLLGQSPPPALKYEPLAALWQWAIASWRVGHVPQARMVKKAVE